MNRQVRLGMIGCGLISHAHGRAALKSRENVRFVACASRDADRSADWARTYGCEAYYTDYASMLREQVVDGVVIATWPANHREHIEAVLAAGIRHVLCEKALTVSAAEACAIWEAADAAEATIMEGYMYRYHPVIQKVRELLDRGAAGVVDSIRGTFHMYQPGLRGAQSDNWRLRPEAGGGVVYDFTCYPVDAINMLAGALPVRVSAGAGRTDNRGLLTRLCGIIEYTNGVIGLVESSHDATFSQALEISGSDGRIALPIAWSVRDDAIIGLSRPIGFLDLEYIETRVPQPDEHDGRLIDFPVFTRQLDNFVAVIRGQSRPGITLSESVVNAVVLEALVESARQGRAVDCSVPMPVADEIRNRRPSWGA